MNDVVPILRDIVLEAKTVYRNIEYDDPMSDSMMYIEDMANRAIEELGGEV